MKQAGRATLRRFLLLGTVSIPAALVKWFIMIVSWRSASERLHSEAASRLCMDNLLDTARLVSRIDQENMLGFVGRFPDYLMDYTRFHEGLGDWKVGNIDSVVVVGMGGSAAAGDFLSDWLGSRMRQNILVLRQPLLPRGVGRRTLVIGLSYSGNTWETLGALREARRRRCMLVAAGSGGQLAVLSRKWLIPFVALDSGIPPRAALSHMLAAAAVVLQEAGVVSRATRDLSMAGVELKQLRGRVGNGVPFSKNSAKAFAAKLQGSVPSIYSLYRMSSVARRFKNQLAENSKLLARFDVLPEACHNEIEGWNEGSAGLSAVLIRDVLEEEYEELMLDRFASLLGRTIRRKTLQVKLGAGSVLGRLLAPVLFLDYVSVYLAILRGVDPSPTRRIAEYKRAYERDRL